MTKKVQLCTIKKFNMNYEFTKQGEIGYLYDSKNQLHGLWFANESQAGNTTKITAFLSMIDLINKTISDADYYAAVSGKCKTQEGPEQIGGVFLLFPSA
jgi:hypothetical protein